MSTAVDFLFLIIQFAYVILTIRGRNRLFAILIIQTKTFTVLFQFSSEIDYVKKQIADFQAATDAQVSSSTNLLWVWSKQEKNIFHAVFTVNRYRMFRKMLHPCLVPRFNPLARFSTTLLRCRIQNLPLRTSSTRIPGSKLSLIVLGTLFVERIPEDLEFIQSSCFSLILSYATSVWVINQCSTLLSGGRLLRDSTWPRN